MTFDIHQEQLRLQDGDVPISNEWVVKDDNLKSTEPKEFNMIETEVACIAICFK